jgi:hypothetical protein
MMVVLPGVWGIVGRNGPLSGVYGWATMIRMMTA